MDCAVQIAGTQAMETLTTYNTETMDRRYFIDGKRVTEQAFIAAQCSMKVRGFSQTRRGKRDEVYCYRATFSPKPNTL